jgi:hypothetical protein
MNENIIRKVKALLATAEHANTPEAEAETAMTMAMMLMGKYAIDEAVVRDRGTRGTVQRRVLRCPAPYSTQKKVLANQISLAFRCQAVGIGDVVVVFGFEADLEQVEMLFTTLLAQMASAAANVRPGYWDDTSAAAVAAYRRSFMLGWTAEVAKRLRDMNRKVEAEANAEHGSDRMAVVLRTNAAAVSDAVRAEYPRTVSTTARSNGAGWGAGRGAGANANIGGAAVRGARAAIGR